MSKNVVIIGAGGHAKVIADIIEKSKDKVYGFLDDHIEKETVIIKQKEIKVIGKVKDCIQLQKEYPELEFIIGIGNNYSRKDIVETYPNLKYYIAIHPSSEIALDVKVEKGTVVMANTCINTSAQIGRHCIINTGAIIEHDDIIEDYVHISPNATLSGTVVVKELTHIGSGAVIKNGINICEKCIIGAGSVVVKDIYESGTYIGVPSKKMR